MTGSSRPIFDWVTARAITHTALFRIVEVTLELLKGQPSRLGILDTVFNPLSVEVADVKRHIAGEKSGSPSSHGGYL